MRMTDPFPTEQQAIEPTHRLDWEAMARKVIRDVLLAQQPNKRFATVEELGALSVFLASDAGASITGTALPVDGGWTAH